MTQGPLRVLVVTPDFPPATGGIQTLMCELVRRLGDAQIGVVTFGSAGDTEYDRQAGFDVRRVRVGAAVRRVRMLLLGLGAAAETRRLKPDVLLLGHVATAPIGILLRYLLRCPVVLYVHADEFRVWPRLCSLALRHVDAAIAVSRHTQSMAVAAGVDPGKVSLIHNGVALGDGRTATPDGSSRPTVISVARLIDRYKGHDVLLRALPLILARAPTAKLMIVGDGPLRAMLEDLADSLDVRDAVQFVGRVSNQERDELLRQANVFAMPTRLPPGGIGGEGFGIVYLEAAAAGLPVVAGDIGAALDSVDPDRTGVLVDATDHVAVAGAVADLLLFDDRARAMGGAGREWAGRFSWERTASRVGELLRDVAGQQAVAR